MIIPTQSHNDFLLCSYRRPYEPEYHDCIFQTVAKIVSRNKMSSEVILNTIHSDYSLDHLYDELYDNCINLASKLCAINTCIENLFQNIEEYEYQEK